MSLDLLIAENKARQDTIHEFSLMIQSKQDELKSIQEQFKTHMDLFTMVMLFSLYKQTQSELNQTKQSLGMSQKELETSLIENKTLACNLKDQKVLTEAHAETESQLQQLTSGLASSLVSSVDDINGLHSKIERKRLLEQRNKDLFETFQTSLLDKMEEMGNGVVRACIVYNVRNLLLIP